jgi:hypothetical protein
LDVSPGKKFARPHFKNKQVWWHAFVLPVTVGSINRKTVVQASLEKKRGYLCKITKTKRFGYMAQVVEHLPSRPEALSSNPSTTHKKKICVVIFLSPFSTSPFRRND